MGSFSDKFRMKFMNEQKQRVNNSDLNLEACQRLVCAVIQQAVEDCQMMQRKGIMQRGRVVEGEADRYNIGLGTRLNGSGHPGRINRLGRGLRVQPEVESLRTFIERDLDEWLALANVEISGDAIRRKLGFAI